jgi:hypothetical protein
VLPAAGEQTTGQLRAALRRTVIAVDPRGADDRRRESEHRAKVSLYADDSGTAALVGSNLPAVQTCRHPTCRQPAWHADLDHTVPYEQGGRTCTCNVGGLCRTHHQVKQEPGWAVAQPRPGHFQITTPAGRAYDIDPDLYPAA